MSARKWIVANSAAVVLAAISGVAHAQTTAPMAPTTNASMTTAPTPTATGDGSTMNTTTTTTSTWTSTSTDGTWPDYKVLMHKPYDYSDLMAAKAKGYDDSHIAVFANIAEKAGVPFNQIVGDVDRGWTFAAIGQKYGLTDSEIYDAQNNITEIKEYKMAYNGVMPAESNLYAEAVSRRDTSLWARALAPSPIPTLSPIAVHTENVAIYPTPTTPVATVNTMSATTVTPVKRPVLAHRTMTKNVRIATPVRRHRYARVTRRHHYNVVRRPVHVKRYRTHRIMSTGVYNRGS